MAGVLQDRRAGAAGNVGAEADVHASCQHAMQGKDGIGEIHIRQRAMRYTGAGMQNRISVRIADEIAMRQDRAPRQQPESVERSGVRDSAARQYVLMFPVTLRTVRLYMTAGLARYPAQSSQQFIRTGWDEARRDGRQNQSACVARHRSYITDEGASLGLGDRGGAIAIEAGTLRGVIHRHPAD